MNIKWNFLILAILAASSIGSIGIFIAEKSLLGILVCNRCTLRDYGVWFYSKEKITRSRKVII
ncbi:DUF5325 family protein [Peribacillus sp. TH14]|uniref:DUF5325 family protein n=1 Tax=Peribacillus sp. TH14 TaxID=2798481 RepID=UPI00406C6553